MFEPKNENTANPDLVTGDWVMRCEERALDDIRALGGNDAADERCFAAADRISQTNLALYRTLAQPIVRALVSAPWADLVRELHPLRLQFAAFADSNPLMRPVASLAAQVRKTRRPVAADNPLLTVQESVSRQIVGALDAWHEAVEALAERTFFAIYGSPTLQAAVGVDPGGKQPLRRAAKSALHRELIEKRITELKSGMTIGGRREAVIRALLFACMGRAAVDERGFAALRRIRRAFTDVPLSTFKAIVREQFSMLWIDAEAALAAIPAMLPDDAGARRRAFELIWQVLGARGEYGVDDLQRIQRVAQLFGIDGRLNGSGNFVIAPEPQSMLRAKAS